MIQPITFFVEGVPKPQPRPKAVRRGQHAGVYDPGTADDWKGCIDRDSAPVRPPAPWSGALRVNLVFYFPRPKAHFLKSGIREDAPKWHTGARDLDNLAKAVLDILTVRRFWGDDGQVASMSIAKCYGSNPGCQIEISELLP